MAVERAWASTQLNARVFFQEQQGQPGTEPASGRARPNSGLEWAELRSGRQGAPQPFLGAAELVTEADVTGSRGGRRTQKQLCVALEALRSRPDKAAGSWGVWGSAPQRRGREGLDSGRGTSPPYTCQWSQATRPPMLAGDERLWRRSEGVSASSGLSPAQFLRPFRLPLPLGTTNKNRILCHPQVPVFLQRLRPEPQCVQAGWSCSRATIPPQQEASTGDGSFLLS